MPLRPRQIGLTFAAARWRKIVSRPRRLMAAREPGTIHYIVATETLNMVNAATVISRLAKIGSAGGDARAWRTLQSARGGVLLGGR